MKIKIKQNDTSFKHLFNDFLTSGKAKGLADKTLSSYACHLKCIGKFTDISRPIEDLTQKDMDRMISAMRDTGLSANTIQSYLRTVSSFFSWCHKNSILTPYIAPYKGEEVIKDTYTDEELKTLLKKPNMKTCSFPEYRNWVIINLLLDCGCRSATIRSIELRDVDLAKGVISYRHTKNRKVQMLPMSSTMVSVLQEYMRIRKGNAEDKLFCTDEGLPMSEGALKSAIRMYNQKRGIRKTSAHLFRHTYARKYLLDCEGDAFTLQHILGHSTLAMTKHYCAIYNADLLKNYDSKSPLAQISQREHIKMR